MSKRSELTPDELARIAAGREAARARALALIENADPEEDARITAAAERDPDALPMSDDQLARMRPAHEVIPQVVAAQMRNKGGRPKSAAPKRLVTLRIKPEVLEAYRAFGKGWQTRMTKVLEDGVQEEIAQDRTARRHTSASQRKLSPSKDV